MLTAGVAEPRSSKSAVSPTLKAVAVPDGSFQLGAVSFQAFVVPSPPEA